MMTLNRRRVMGNKEKLPAGAVRIEYLKGTNEQRIDTRLTKGNSDFESDIDIEFVSAVGMARAAFSGADWAVSSHMTFDPVNMKVDVQSIYQVNYPIIYGSKYKISCVFGTSNVIMTLYDANGNYLGKVTRPTMSWLSSNKYHYLIFDINNYGSTSHAILTIKVYGNKIYQGGILVRDFIPVRVGSTGYMYDKVSKQLFGNSGTGNFVLGPDK